MFKNIYTIQADMVNIPGNLTALKVETLVMHSNAQSNQNL